MCLHTGQETGRVRRRNLAESPVARRSPQLAPVTSPTEASNGASEPQNRWRHRQAPPQTCGLSSCTGRVLEARLSVSLSLPDRMACGARRRQPEPAARPGRGSSAGLACTGSASRPPATSLACRGHGGAHRESPPGEHSRPSWPITARRSAEQTLQAELSFLFFARHAHNYSPLEGARRRPCHGGGNPRGPRA